MFPVGRRAMTPVVRVAIELSCCSVVLFVDLSIGSKLQLTVGCVVKLVATDYVLGTVRLEDPVSRGEIDTSADAVALTINTVDDNKSRYMNRDYSRALLARKTQDTIGRPSTRSYLHIIDNNLLPNCPVTREDALAAKDILAANLASLKGKTTRSVTSHVQATPTTLPIQIMSRYKDVTIAGDIMYVNKVPFLCMCRDTSNLARPR
jgi:hypothetical protein